VREVCEDVSLQWCPVGSWTALADLRPPRRRAPGGRPPTSWRLTVSWLAESRRSACAEGSSAESVPATRPALLPAGRTRRSSARKAAAAHEADNCSPPDCERVGRRPRDACVGRQGVVSLDAELASASEACRRLAERGRGRSRYASGQVRPFGRRGERGGPIAGRRQVGRAVAPGRLVSHANDGPTTDGIPRQRFDADPWVPLYGSASRDVQPRVATIASRAAQASRSRFSMAAAIRSGNWSGVQANVGMPTAAKARALSWS
jgi:hypothetical protein